MHHQPAALIFDLNGTMINDMEYHEIAWHSILNEDLHAGMTREQVKSHMYGKNEELLERIFGKDRFTKEQVEAISLKKERSYQEAFRPHLELIKGLPAFLGEAARLHIPMAIGSAAIPFNIDFVLDNLGIRSYFGTIVSADDVAHSKPDPETYLKVARNLQVPATGCIVFEDAPKGVEAAANAGMKTVVLTTMHHPEEFAPYDNILLFVKDYTDFRLNGILNKEVPAL